MGVQAVEDQVKKARSLARSAAAAAANARRQVKILKSPLHDYFLQQI